jgi:hypothetical protein
LRTNQSLLTTKYIQNDDPIFLASLPSSSAQGVGLQPGRCGGGESATAGLFGAYFFSRLLQLLLDGATVRARLTQLILSEASSNSAADPKWRVQVESNDIVMEVPETDFGKLLVAAADQDDDDSPTVPESGGKKEADDKKPLFSAESSPVGSDESLPGELEKTATTRGRKSRVSTRQARSLRRQSMVEQGKNDVIQSAINTLAPQDKNAEAKPSATATTSTTTGRKRGRPALSEKLKEIKSQKKANTAVKPPAKPVGRPLGSGKNKQQQPPAFRNFSTGVTGSNNQVKKEEVVKVKLLTGTLFIYKGRRRRAEFVRRV